MTFWLYPALVIAMHEEQLARHGGTVGLNDEEALAWALERPLFDGELSGMGARYAIRILQCSPFVDGNERTAYLALESFLSLNGSGLAVSDADAAETFFRLAVGYLPASAFAQWVKTNAAP